MKTKENPYLFNGQKMISSQFKRCIGNFLVLFFWSSGIMECTCLLFTFENGVLLMC